MEIIPSDFTINVSDTTLFVNRVLLLDDESNLRDLIKKSLEALFCTVVAVSNGVDGVRAVLNDDFDIIICDMMMPKMPGDKFYTAIERVRPDLCRRFVFITGYGGDPKIEEFIKRAQGTVLYKPFDIDQLIATVSSVHSKPQPSAQPEPALAAA